MSDLTDKLRASADPLHQKAADEIDAYERDVQRLEAKIAQQPACKTCRFSFASYSGWWEATCRRHAPVRDLPVAFPSSQPDESAKWPRVMADEWCGEYERAADR